MHSANVWPQQMHARSISEETLCGEIAHGCLEDGRLGRLGYDKVGSRSHAWGNCTWDVYKDDIIDVSAYQTTTYASRV